MNKIKFPADKIRFFETLDCQEAREANIGLAYVRLFDIARRNILEKRALTNAMTQKYTEVQHGNEISNNRRGSENTTSQQANGL